MADVAPVLRATAKALADIGKAHCGSGAWGLIGVDGQQPIPVTPSPAEKPHADSAESESLAESAETAVFATRGARVNSL